MKQIEAVAAERRALPPGPILQTYIFDEGPQDLTSSAPSKQTSLLDLAKETEKPLVIYHMMMGETHDKACSGCSMFLDAINGVAKHLAQRVNLAVVAKAPLEAIRKYAKRREWNDLRFLSAFGNSFNKDMNVEVPEWMPEMWQVPGFSVFQYEKAADGEEVVRFLYHTNPAFGRNEDGGLVIRGMDLTSPVWNIFDLTPQGRGESELEYIGK